MSATAVPAIIALKMRRYKEAFRAAGAVTPATAMRPAEAGLRESVIFHKLVRQGVLVAAGNGRYYLDERRDATVRSNKRKIVVALLAIILVLLAIGLIAASVP
jgi:O-antigen ligase